MDFITTHLSADFDAFAAAVCAVRLYPGHRVLFPGSQEAAVRRFLAATGWPFPEIRLREARRARWKHAVVVDTRNPRRLGEAWELIQRDGCPVDLIDHHTDEPDGLGAREVISRPVGSTCTILADLMAERGIVPSPEEASLMLMGMYEDTGGLSYRETTAEDLRTAAWLIEQGGSLELVRRWVLKGLEPEQFDLLNRIVEGTEEITVNGVPVAVSVLEVDHYHEEAAYVVHRWVETFDLAVGIVLLARPPHVNLILRSRLPGLHVGRVAQHFGGGGHPTAASARVDDRMPVEVREELLRVLGREMPPPLRARDVAVRHIFTVPADLSVGETKERLNQLKVNALPVRSVQQGTLVGLVTRQILDGALSHRFADKPVETVMHPEVPTVSGETTLEDLRDLFLERSYRFVVVEESGRPVGLVTRMELFRRLFERQHEVGAGVDNRMRGTRPVSHSVARLLREVAPAWVQEMVGHAAAVGAELGVPVYLVGGLVRDLLLERPNEDLDLVVEGNGIEVAARLAAITGATCRPHEPFLTAVLTLPDGHTVDVASARTEFYRTPAALPEVQTSLIRQDLYRRDFTVNALAVALGDQRHDQLVDFFGGRKDLARREIRVLHSLSFIDDPTRAIRAVRYARRLDFRIAADTRHLITTAIHEGIFARLSGQRLRRELELLLAEAHPARSLALLAELGLVKAIAAPLGWDHRCEELLLELEGQLAWFELEGIEPAPERWFLFLSCLALCAGEPAFPALAERLQLTGRLHQRMITVPEDVAALRTTADPEVPLSERVGRVATAPSEILLLAMATQPLPARRLLAEAAVTAARTVLPVAGRDLVAAGVPPGPQIGAALRATRSALLDRRITAEEAVAFAVATAQRLREGDEA